MAPLAEGRVTMRKITLSEAELAAWRHWRFSHPDPRIPMRMEALSLRSQGVPHRDILRLCGSSHASFPRSLTASVRGGREPLQHREPRPLRRARHRHRQPIEADFQQRPPATVAEAAAKSEALTGSARKPPQVLFDGAWDAAENSRHDPRQGRCGRPRDV
jgi:hypothetical protein